MSSYSRSSVTTTLRSFHCEDFGGAQEASQVLSALRLTTSIVIDYVTGFDVKHGTRSRQGGQTNYGASLGFKTRLLSRLPSEDVLQELIYVTWRYAMALRKQVLSSKLPLTGAVTTIPSNRVRCFTRVVGDVLNGRTTRSVEQELLCGILKGGDAPFDYAELPMRFAGVRRDSNSLLPIPREKLVRFENTFTVTVSSGRTLKITEPIIFKSLQHVCDVDVHK